MFLIALVVFSVALMSRRPDSIIAQGAPPSPINDPDAFAWALFQELNADAATGDGRVVWETWKSATTRLTFSW
jgi:hypothetical protein